MTGKSLVVVPSSGDKPRKTMDQLREEAAAERAQIRDEGRRQGHAEAHHARKYLLAAVGGFCLIVGFCLGALATAGMYERSMTSGAAIGAAARDDGRTRLTIDGDATNDRAVPVQSDPVQSDREDEGWVRGPHGWTQPERR